MKILLLDRAIFPRDKICGDGLTPRCVAAIDRLGVLDQVNQVAQRIDQFKVIAPDETTIVSEICALEVERESAYMLAIPRLALDYILVKNAVMTSATLIEGCKVTGIENNADGVGVMQGGLVHLGEGPVLVSRSPELFFRVSADGLIKTRPMNGTVPRGASKDEDDALMTYLKNDPKNRAENLMIVDLLRNDISRLSKVGSVNVPELFTVETYATVHQLTSLVRAQLLSGVNVADMFGALFPCGSITGAPKIRAMEVIRELEPQARDIYCGSIGWMAPDGQASYAPYLCLKAAV